MTEDWKQYQNQVAEFFRSLGLSATVEASVEGARGIHDIDVWVTFSKYGLDIRWAVECKLWKSAITKEKVLALQQIAHDVGADRAILSSESGFQAGAIQIARKSNVTLTSLEELRANAHEEIIEFELTKATKRFAILDSKLRPLIFDNDGFPFPQPGIDRQEIISLMGDMLILKLALPKAAARDFPVWSIAGDRGSVQSRDPNEFVQNTTEAMDWLENEIETLLSRASKVQQRCLLISHELIEAVERLIVDAEVALLEVDENSDHFQPARLQALASMKDVGYLSEQVEALARRDLSARLHSLMRLLIDTVYLDLTKHIVPQDAWSNTKEAVADSLDQFRRRVAA